MSAFLIHTKIRGFYTEDQVLCGPLPLLVHVKLVIQNKLLNMT